MLTRLTYVYNTSMINVWQSDFGAAFMYDTKAEYGNYIENIEIRPFQVLLEELVKHYYYDDNDNIGNSSSKKLMLTTLMNQWNVASTFSDLYIYWQQQQLKNIAKTFATEDA